ncbi:uncharacterized protein LOC108743661 [Agrilus planipennis]|uniref:Uncharacterized protein LOC108743661 n=1 Tax=Agrilus planipennis TaxID=224129 RepID=A0A1W4XQR0_AGRPL|nr:uncharacterized protein LOC108743661 [Agrilus planipennis]
MDGKANSNNNNWHGTDGIALVIPLKIAIPPPLHEHDIIYDQEHNNTQEDFPPLRHHSGHFRNNEAEVWDPQPHYEIDMFGKKLYLELSLKHGFIPSFLQILTVLLTHSEWMWKNV